MGPYLKVVYNGGIMSFKGFRTVLGDHRTYFGEAQRDWLAGTIQRKRGGWGSQYGN